MGQGALPSRELGLALGLIVGRHVLGVQDLHYGYWPDDLPLTLQNLPRAQALYTDVLLEAIPEGVHTILDVGCGAGNTAARLVERGYSVDCLSPNPVLNGVVRERLGDQVGLFEGRFEEFRTRRRYDLVLFSECLLFIHLRPGLEKALTLLNPGGYALISDIFRTTRERGPIGGGHDLAKFREALSELPWDVLSDRDISPQIARTFDLIDQTARALRPGYDLIQAQLRSKHPATFRFVRWLFKTKLTRYEQKHFGRVRDGAAFLRHKSYRVLLLKKRTADEPLAL